MEIFITIKELIDTFQSHAFNKLSKDDLEKRYNSLLAADVNVRSCNRKIVADTMKATVIYLRQLEKGDLDQYHSIKAYEDSQQILELNVEEMIEMTMFLRSQKLRLLL